MDILLAAGAGFGTDRAHHSRWDRGHQPYAQVQIPVIIAALKGLCEPLERLLSAGADPNVVDPIRRSALHLACLHNRGCAFEVLLRHNAIPAEPCDKGLSPPDVVAVVLLKNQKQLRNRWRTPAQRTTFCSPATLNAAEPAAADNIREMLERASAWSRRCWLVVLRT